MDSSAHPSSVLVVDDDRLLVDTLAVWLEDEGFEVRRAYDALQGLASANRTSPDLVLADVLMPGLNGVSLVARLREKGVPVVVAQLVDPPPEMLPDIPFLTKPFDIADIYDVIVKTLSEHGHRTTVARER